MTLQLLYTFCCSSLPRPRRKTFQLLPCRRKKAREKKKKNSLRAFTKNSSRCSASEAVPVGICPKDCVVLGAISISAAMPYFSRGANMPNRHTPSRHGVKYFQRLRIYHLSIDLSISVSTHQSLSIQPSVCLSVYFCSLPLHLHTYVNTYNAHLCIGARPNRECVARPWAHSRYIPRFRLALFATRPPRLAPKHCSKNPRARAFRPIHWEVCNRWPFQVSRCMQEGARRAKRDNPPLLQTPFICI